MSETDPQTESAAPGDMSAESLPEDSGLHRAIEEAERAVSELAGSSETKSTPGAGTASSVAALAGLRVEVEAARADLAKAQAAADDFRDKWVRSLADFENARKRSRRDIDDASLRAVSGLLDDFFPVYDNLQRALGTAGSTEGPLVTGIKMVQHAFVQALARHGVSPIDSEGRPFDPALHEALQQIDSPDHAPGVVVKEFEKGFVKGDRLMRPARVIVAGPGSTGVYPEEPESGSGGGLEAPHAPIDDEQQA